MAMNVIHEIKLNQEELKKAQAVVKLISDIYPLSEQIQHNRGNMFPTGYVKGEPGIDPDVYSMHLTGDVLIIKSSIFDIPKIIEQLKQLFGHLPMDVKVDYMFKHIITVREPYKTLEDIVDTIKTDEALVSLLTSCYAQFQIVPKCLFDRLCKYLAIPIEPAESQKYMIAYEKGETELYPLVRRVRAACGILVR